MIMVVVLSGNDSKSDFTDDDAESVNDVGVEINDNKLGLDERDVTEEYAVESELIETELRLSVALLLTKLFNDLLLALLESLG